VPPSRRTAPLGFGDGLAVELYALDQSASGHQLSRRFTDPGVEVPYFSAGDIAQLEHREVTHAVTHLGMHLLEYSGRKGLSRAGDRARHAIVRLIPERSMRSPMLHLAPQPLCTGPDFAFTDPDHQMSPAGTIQPEDHLLQVWRQQTPQRPDGLP
jgi:hypothetical protein